MSTREKWRKATGLLLVGLILACCSSAPARTFFALPEHVWLPQGQTQRFALQVPFRATVRSTPAGALAVNGEVIGSEGYTASMAEPLAIGALQTGHYTLDVRLLGLIPLRRMTVDVVPPIRVIPGGHSIGVLLKSRGVMVVGHAVVRDSDGVPHQPGRDAGIEQGDMMLTIDGTEVTSEEQTARLFQEAGRKGRAAEVTVKRKGHLLQKQVLPVRDKESGRWRVGLYIRDGAAGVGTLTFYDPSTGRYGALGHVIADGETNLPIEIREGHIVDAVVTAIQKGRKGLPGEKIGTMQGNTGSLGSIDRNTRFGISGQMKAPVKNPLYPEAIPVAMADQVHEGPAEMVTVVEGRRLERFDLEIVRVMRQPTAEGKNMIVKVTDPRLLTKTGGIVQGMSGSPILQDGRIVGAVTHVFVNDPTRGYGALIEWMLQEAGVLMAGRQTSFERETSRSLLFYNHFVKPAAANGDAVETTYFAREKDSIC